MEFLKLDPDIDTDPAVMRAGWWGARFYELLLKVSAKKDLKGRIGPDYQDARYLARLWNLTPEDFHDRDPAAVIEEAARAAEAAGLFFRDGEDWMLRGWDKYYRPAKPAAIRTAEYEQRQREAGLVKKNGQWVQREDAHNPHNPHEAREDNSRPHETHATPPTPLHPPTPPTEEKPPLSQNPVVAAGGLRVESIAVGATPGRRAEDRPPQIPVTVRVPEKDPESWDGKDFWFWAQSVRQDGGLVAEKPPNDRTLSFWFNRCLMTEGVTVHVLKEAFYAFGQEKYWEAQRFPFAAFMSQWASFARKDVRHASAS